MKYRPYLHIDIDLGFFRAGTNVMRDQLEWGCREYMAFQVRFFKWHIVFSLYDTYKRILEREYNKTYFCSLYIRNTDINKCKICSASNVEYGKCEHIR